MSNRRDPSRMRGRAVPSPEPVPVWTAAQLVEYMAQRPGRVSHLELRHDSDCPAVGTGRNCRCRPDQFFYDGDLNLIARVEG